MKKTHEKIADQLKIGSATVTRAAEFTSAVDTIVKNTGIKVNDILSGKVKPIIKDIVSLATEYSPEMQVRVISRVTEKGDLDIKETLKNIVKEDKLKLAQEAMERERIAEEKAKAERLERERLEAERLRKEREEKEKAEKERLEKEHSEREKLEAYQLKLGGINGRKLSRQIPRQTPEYENKLNRQF